MNLVSPLLSSRRGSSPWRVARALVLAVLVVGLVPTPAAADPPESSSIWPQLLASFSVALGAGAAGTLLGGAAGTGVVYLGCPMVNCPSLVLPNGPSIPDPALLLGGAAFGGTLGAGAALWVAGLGMTLVAE